MARPKKIQDPEKIEADNRLLDRVAQGFDSRSDRDLAKRLGIPASTMSKVRAREAELAWHHRVVLMDKLGFLSVRRAVAAIIPDAMARRVVGFTNTAFENMTRRRNIRELDHDDANLLNFFDGFPRISGSGIFRAHCGLTDTDKDAIRAGRALTPDQRVKILEALYLSDPTYWAFDLSLLSSMIACTSVLLEELERLAYPMDENSELNLALIQAMERHYGGSKRFAEAVDLSPSQLSQIKRGDANLGMRTRLKLLAELERVSEEGDFLDFDDLDALASSPELIGERLESGHLD